MNGDERFDIDVGYQDPWDYYDFTSERRAQIADQRREAQDEPSPPPKWRERENATHKPTNG